MSLSTAATPGEVVRDIFVILRPNLHLYVHDMMKRSFGPMWQRKLRCACPQKHTHNPGATDSRPLLKIIRCMWAPVFGKSLGQGLRDDVAFLHVLKNADAHEEIITPLRARKGYEAASALMAAMNPDTNGLLDVVKARLDEIAPQHSAASSRTTGTSGASTILPAPPRADQSRRKPVTQAPVPTHSLGAATRKLWLHLALPECPEFTRTHCLTDGALDLDAAYLRGGPPQVGALRGCGLQVRDTGTGAVCHVLPGSPGIHLEATPLPPGRDRVVPIGRKVKISLAGVVFDLELAYH